MNTTAQLKQSMKKSAKLLAEEPLEILKSVRKQVTGENLQPTENPFEKIEDPQKIEEEQKYKQQKAESDGRHLEALENELKDIRRQKIFNELMQRINQGEEIPLEVFSELSYEQKDVLKAQIEAVKKQQAVSNQSQNTLIEPTAKKGRQLLGQKQSAQKQTTRVEKPVPPSG